MNQRFGVHDNEAYFKESDSQTNEWVVNFLLNNSNPNPQFAKALKNKPLSWTAALEIDIDSLDVIAGPGKKYNIESNLWNRRIGRIIETFSDLRLFPPVIVFAEGQDGSQKLVVGDGAHRIEALKRLKYRTVWALVGFSDVAAKQSFLSKQSTREPVMSTPVAPAQGVLNKHYLGGVADSYDRVRELQPHWHTEHGAVVKLMLPHHGKSVLDAPIGTGRFVKLYQALECKVTGLDISPDMLAIAGQKAAMVGMKEFRAIQGSVADPIDTLVDVSLCIRFINLVPGEIAARIVGNLAKVTREEILIHLTSIDIDTVPENQRAAIRANVAAKYNKQRDEMSFAPHLLGDFVSWSNSAGFKIAQSIECQERHGWSHTHVVRLVKI